MPDACDSAAVTVVVPPFSAMAPSASASVTVGASSSRIVPVPDASPSSAFTGSLSARTTVSFGSTLKSPYTDTETVSLVSPGANTSPGSGGNPWSTPSAARRYVPAVAVPALSSIATATLTSWSLAGASVTVQVSLFIFEGSPGPPSATFGESTNSVGVDERSSSRIVNVTTAGAATSSLPTLPDTVTDLSNSASALSTAAIVTVPLLVIAPAAMVSFLFVLRVKSPASALVPAAAETVTVVAAPTARDNVAVTVAVLPVPFSSMVEGVSVSVEVAEKSSSRIVPVPVDGPSTALTGSARTTSTVSFGSSVPSPVTETLTLPLVSPAAMVRMPEDSAA